MVLAPLSIIAHSPPIPITHRCSSDHCLHVALLQPLLLHMARSISRAAEEKAGAQLQRRRQPVLYAFALQSNPYACKHGVVNSLRSACSLETCEGREGACRVEHSYSLSCALCGGGRDFKSHLPVLWFCQAQLLCDKFQLLHDMSQFNGALGVCSVVPPGCDCVITLGSLTTCV